MDSRYITTVSQIMRRFLIQPSNNTDFKLELKETSHLYTEIQEDGLKEFYCCEIINNHERGVQLEDFERIKKNFDADFLRNNHLMVNRVAVKAAIKVSAYEHSILVYLSFRG